MQLTYSQTPPAYVEGDLADSGPHDVISTIAEAAADLDIEPGLVVVRGTDPDRQAQLPPAVAADPDSLKTDIGSTAGVQTFTGADFEGEIGTGRISPPAKIDLVLDAHTDWDATSATLIYYDEHGVERTETLSIPDGGDATVTSEGYASAIKSLAIPAQTGTGGTATLGTSASVTMEGGDVLGVVVRTHKARRDGASANCEDYEDESRMPVCREGRIAVKVENAFTAGDRPFVRAIAGVGERRGAIRVGDSDGGDCFEWSGGRLVTSGSAGEVGVLEVLGN